MYASCLYREVTRSPCRCVYIQAVAESQVDFLISQKPLLTEQPDEKEDEESVEHLASAKQAEIWVAKPKLDSAVEEQRTAQKDFEDASRALDEKKCVARPRRPPRVAGSGHL